MGQQHPDHQRRDARRRRHRDRLPGRRQRLGQRHRGVGRAGDAPWSRAPTAPQPLADAAEDRAELVAGDAAADWEDAPGETSIEVFDAFAATLGEAFGQADAEQRILYGFVFHEVTTTYLGSSTGLRLRHVQPTGHYGCTGKNAELTNSAWVGGATRDFADVDAARMAADLATRLVLGRAPHRPARRSLRHGAAAERGRRPDDRRLLERRRPQRRRRPDASSPARRRHPHRRGARQPGRPPASPTRRTPGWSAPRSWSPAAPRTAAASTTTACRWAAPTGSPTAGSPR